MLGNKKVVCIIPARLQSTRFPRKMLINLKGKPLLQWVWEAATKVAIFDEVAFAVDAQETATLIEAFGGRYYMTSQSCMSGTDRLVELSTSGRVSSDIWVNWQGDEPFVTGQMIHDLLHTAHRDKSDLWTLKKRIVNTEDALNPHISKVVTNDKGFALYFSRSAIPYYRDPCPDKHKVFFKHVGIYAYSERALLRIRRMQPSYLEEAEQLEQLRFLYHRLKIRVHETEQEVFGIDLPEHVVKAEAYLEALIS